MGWKGDLGIGSSSPFCVFVCVSVVRSVLV